MARGRKRHRRKFMLGTQRSRWRWRKRRRRLRHGRRAWQEFCWMLARPKAPYVPLAERLARDIDRMMIQELRDATK